MAEIKINTFPTGLTYSRNTKAPLESNRLFDTLALAQAYVDNVDQNAYVGLTVSVVSDGENNGLYYVEQIADAEHTSGILKKVGSDSSEDVKSIATDVDTLKGVVGDSESGLVADVAVVKSNLDKKADTFTVDKGLSYSENKISVVVNRKEGNLLTVDKDGLYVSSPDITVPEYTLTTVSAPSSEYASQYEFKKDGVVLNTINIPKDQFLKTASYDSDENKLIFVFNTTAGETTSEVDVADLVDTYTAGDYITITNSSISVDYESIKNKINNDLVASVSTTLSGISNKVTEAEGKITNLENAKSDHENRLAALEGVEHPTKDQVNNLENNFSTLNQSVTNIIADVEKIKVKDVDATVSNGISLKLDTAGKIGVNVDIDTLAAAVIEKHVVSFDSESIKTTSAIGPNESGASVQTVLENLDSRISAAISGGVTSVAAGNGISVDVSDVNNPKVSVNVISGSALKATSEGLDLV